MRKPIDTTPFDRYRVPPKQNLFFMPFIWLFCWLLTLSGRLKIYKKRMKGLKPPFLVLGTHHAFMDFYVTPLALFPQRANYISELEGFENFGEWLYRQAGCLGTRKFVNDIALIKNIKRVIDRKGILVLYPEARYANVGTSSQLPASVGKLAKLLDVPVVTLNMKGNYLQSPIWNLKKRRGVRLQATITQLYTQDELRNATLDEVNAQVQQALHYDEYAWQYTQNMHIDAPFRAEGLEMVLYQCPVCSTEHHMYSKGTTVGCRSCGANWQMTTLGKLEQTAGAKPKNNIDFTHIPNWYEWQRAQVEKAIDVDSYTLMMPVQIDSLPNAKNFINLGKGQLTHGQDGFFLTFTEYGDTSPTTLHFAPRSMYSVHTEYEYRKKGPCITLSTLDNTYFLFPLQKGFNPTKIQFATEYLFSQKTKRT